MEDIFLNSSSRDPTNFNISESLVPPRELKSAGNSSITFDGLLQEPLILKEDLKEGCGGQLWPAGIVLAKYMLRKHHQDLVDKTMFVYRPALLPLYPPSLKYIPRLELTDTLVRVELGAGGGLVGLAVARGCNIGSGPIYVTDQEPMLPLMKTNIELNNLSSAVAATVLNWGEPLPDCIPTHPAIILAADCVYFEPAFPLLISTLQDLLGPDSVCYFCFKRRRRADLRFMKSAKKIFDVKQVEDDPDLDIYKRENIFLCSIRLKSGSGKHPF